MDKQMANVNRQSDCCIGERRKNNELNMRTGNQTREKCGKVAKHGGNECAKTSCVKRIIEILIGVHFNPVLQHLTTGVSSRKVRPRTGTVIEHRSNVNDNNSPLESSGMHTVAIVARKGNPDWSRANDAAFKAAATVRASDASPERIHKRPES